jgi:hypothetical protein
MNEEEVKEATPEAAEEKEPWEEGYSEDSDQEADLQAIMGRMLPVNGKAMKNREIFERAEFTFPVSGASCLPGVFVDSEGKPMTFKLTVTSLLHSEEIEATRTIKGATDLPFALSKRSLFKFNGVRIDQKKRDFLWEAIGPKGRQLVVYAFSQMNSAGDEAVGKMQSGLEV